jgi:Ser/Thr protein kinase RdoA (MazF antagonist)
MFNQVFPAVYSTLDSKAISSSILSEYAIDPPITCQFWHRGLSDVYLVETTNRPYILRISHQHWRSADEIYFELELLKFLQQKEIPVAYPLSTKKGTLAIELNASEGKRYATLFNYAPGKIALGDLNERQSYILGNTLAKIHGATSDFSTSYRKQDLTIEYLIDDSLTTIAPFLKVRQEDFIYLCDIVETIKDKLKLLERKAPFWVVCWGDPHSGNAHFTADNQVTLFDFDQCGYGWRAFDIAKFLQISLRTGISRKLRDAFLTGYQSVNELTFYELESLQALTQVAHIWMWAISLQTAMIHNWSSLDDSFFSKRMSQLKGLNCQDWQLF